MDTRFPDNAGSPLGLRSMACKLIASHADALPITREVGIPKGGTESVSIVLQKMSERLGKMLLRFVETNFTPERQIQFPVSAF